MNIFDLVKRAGAEPKRVAGTHGGEYHSPCPGCGGEDRFHIWPAQNNGEGSFWCRQCGKGGDVIQFLMEFDGKTFAEACAALGRRMPRHCQSKWYPARPNKQQWRPSPSDRQPGTDETLWRLKAVNFVDWTHAQLMNNRTRLAVLGARGIRPETAVRYKLGWNPGETGKKDIFRPRQAWGLPKEAKNGREKRLWLPRGYVVPCFCGRDLRRVRIRRPDEDLTETFNQRYYVVPGSAMDPLVIGVGGRVVVLVESELDAMLLRQEIGDLAGIVALGTSHAKPDPACHEALTRALCILCALDFDHAGASAWKWWRQQYARAERWPPPLGKDPGEAYQAGASLLEWVTAGLPPALTAGARNNQSRTMERRFSYASHSH